MVRKCVAAAMPAVVVALLVAGCGGGGGNGASSTKGKQYVDAVVAHRQSNDFLKALNPTQARCVASKLVDAVGVSTLEKSGVTPQNIAASNGLQKLKGHISKDQANKAVDAITSGSCFDFAEVAATQTPSLAKLGKAKVDCLYNRLFALPTAHDQLVDSLVTGSQPDFSKVFSNQSEFFTILGKCKISPKELEGT